MNDIDRLDRLSALSSKLYSLLAMTSGEAGPTFRNMTDDLQDKFLWACCDMAQEVERLSEEVSGYRAVAPDIPDRPS
jgi:hypothetical protein